MGLRYERDTSAPVTLTGGMRVHFPADTYEISLDDPEFEQEVAEQYDAVEYIDDTPDDVCGTIKTNGEPCDRLAEECHFHSQDDDSDAEEEEADASADEDADADADSSGDEDEDESESSYDYDL